MSNVDLIAWAFKILSYAKSVNAKLEDAWPHIKIIGEECEHILTVVNGGKPVVHAGGPSTLEGIRLVSDLSNIGADSAEAGKVVSAFETLSGRLS